MWPYLVLIFFPICFSLMRKKTLSLANYSGQFIDRVSMNLFWLLLFALLSLRRIDVGRDVGTYEIIFKLIGNSDWKFTFYRSNEIGWNCFNKVIFGISQDFRWVLVITAILSIAFLRRAFLKYSTDTSLSIVLFVSFSCFLLLFSGLRQSIAVSIGMLSFDYAMKKKRVKFFLCVAVAMLFHTSAFILLFIYPLCHIKVKTKWLIWVIPAIIVVYIFNQPIFTFLGTILETFTDYDATIELTSSYTMLFLLSLFAVFSFVIPEESKLDDETEAMRNILLLCVILQTFAPLHMLAMRMNYYFIIFIPLLIPRVIKYSKKNMAQVAIVARYVMLIYFIFYFVIIVPRDNVLDTFPYHFFWE